MNQGGRAGDRLGTTNINFDANKKVKRVQAIKNGGGFVAAMTFFDKRNQEIGFYDPNKWNQKQGLIHEIHEIGDNEELIGVYGVKDKNLYFYNFGFIVKVRQDWPDLN